MLTRYILILIVTLFLYAGNVNANINLTVSPIKYEIVTDPGNTITRKATLFNNSENSYTIFTGKSDFESKNNSGNPLFIKRNKLIDSGQALSSWINIDTKKFLIEPGEKKEIEFTITVPDDAVPGGHYGAVFFKNNNTNQNSGAQININVDYGVLLLVKVNGDIITNVDIDDTVIINPFGELYKGLEKDKCFIIDLTPSKYDGRCLRFFFLDYDDIELNSADDNIQDFIITFETLFKNLGNTHIKPYGTIRLVDENGKEIKGIGKEVVKNEAGAITGEKIVDYLPINDNGGNILPGANRNYISEWKGFPYEGYNSEGKIIIKYWTPEEYYTRENINKKQFLLPWERVNEKINHKKLKALINIIYLNKDGESVEFNSAQDLYIDYKEKYVGLNPYVFIYTSIIIIVILIIFFILIYIFGKKKCKCQKCDKKIENDMLICPYCGKKQKKKIK